MDYSICHKLILFNKLIHGDNLAAVQAVDKKGLSGSDKLKIDVKQKKKKL